MGLVENGTLRLFGALGVIAAAGSYADFGPPPEVGTVDLAAHLANLAALALVIERTVEVYLGIRGHNGAERVPLNAQERLDPEGVDVQRKATILCLILGSLVAAAGVRVLPYMGITWAEGDPVWDGLRSALDILLTGGLLGGGSLIVHEAAETVKGGFRALSAKASGAAEEAGGPGGPGGPGGQGGGGGGAT